MLPARSKGSWSGNESDFSVGENVIAGPAMQRRAMYQFGIPLPKGADGLVNAGIGPGLSTGTSSLIPPTKEIGETGETMTIDGVKMVFQFTPGGA